MFQLDAWLVRPDPDARMSDLTPNLLLSLGEHVEAKLTTDSLIKPLPGYVENIAGDPERLKPGQMTPFSSYISITFPGFEKASHTGDRV